MVVTRTPVVSTVILPCWKVCEQPLLGSPHTWSPVGNPRVPATPPRFACSVRNLPVSAKAPAELLDTRAFWNAWL